MAALPGKTDADTNAGIGLWPIRFALRPAPSRFNVANFAARICQHLIVYAGLLIAAVYGCLFVFAPAQASLLSVAIIAVSSILILSLSSPRNKIRRLLEGGLMAGYIVGLAVLMRAFEFVTGLLVILLSRR